MSKPRKPFSPLIFVFAVSLQIFTLGAVINAQTAQIAEAKIAFESVAPAVAKVEGRFAASQERKLSLALSVAGIENLGARVFDLKLKNAGGASVSYKKLIDGEFLADEYFSRFEYKIKLDQPKKMSAHVSWASGEHALLMTGDLLPLADEKRSAKITLELPPQWSVATSEKSEKSSATNVYEVTDVEKGVFFAGKNFRGKTLNFGNAAVNFTISGDFLFSDEDAYQSAGEIFAEYEKLFGAPPAENIQISLARFPSDVKHGRWEAETRGRTVSIVSADMSFNTQSIQRLREQLRHEIFHLWMPNDLNLSGNYDWFYEGFALYQSLRLGVRLNKLRFTDFLDTLSRAYTADDLQTQKVSLLEASKNRWNGANTQIYARGMIVAFLIDITLLRESKGKRSLANVLREIYQKHNARSGARVDGSEAILKFLEADQSLRPITEKYVRRAEKIIWQTDLAAVGIEAAERNFVTVLSVKAKPGGREKDLLDELGYNNWRKLSQHKK